MSGRQLKLGACIDFNINSESSILYIFFNFCKSQKYWHRCTIKIIIMKKKDINKSFCNIFHDIIEKLYTKSG